MIVRVAIVRSMRGRGMATVPVAIGRSPVVPSENSTATRSFRAVRAKDFGDRPDRAREFGRDRGDAKPWQKREDGAERNARPAREGARNFDRPKFDKPRYDKPREGDRSATQGIALVINARGFRVRAQIALKAIVRFVSVRSSIVPARTVRNSTARAGIAPATLGVPKAAPIGRSIRAASRAAGASIVRAGKMRTTARSLQSARHSAAAAPIASATKTSAGPHGRRRSRNPASASPRCWRAPGSLRAAMPRRW